MTAHAHAASHAPARAESVEELRRRAWEVLAGLAGTATGCLVAIVALTPSSFTSNDARRLAVIALLGGALGASVSALIQTCDRYAAGIELADGSAWPPGEPGGHRFSDRELPFLVLRPVLGAVMGLIVYAGFVGGLLISTTKTPDSFSPQGLVFVSVLAGLFAKTFLARVRVVFKAMLGGVDKEVA
jgi:hypothetical protein